MNTLEEKLIELDSSFDGEGPKEDPVSKFEVHRILAHSYFLYFFSFLLGVVFDLIFEIKIPSNNSLVSLGEFLVFFGTALVLWAQHTSRNMHREAVTHETFFRGPYRFTRSPTHMGLYFLLLGFGLVSHGLFVVVFTTISALVTKFVFLRREEKVLEKKYGEHYTKYKKSVKL